MGNNGIIEVYHVNVQVTLPGMVTTVRGKYSALVIECGMRPINNVYVGEGNFGMGFRA